MTSTLDDAGERRRLDPGGMLASIAGLPEQCREAWKAARLLDVPGGNSPVDRIVILGMGGSAIAGDIFRVLLQLEAAIPVFNVRAYDLPPYVDERTLVIASSFSGETEETIHAFQQALGTPAQKLAITTGGRLQATARANGIPVFSYQFGGEPRAAIGWSLMPLLALGQSTGLMPQVDSDIEEMCSALQRLREVIGEKTPLQGNQAKQLAGQLYDRLPVIYGAGPLLEVAHRWKTQLNESSKVWAFYEELPEAQHNAVIGLGLPAGVARQVTVVFLTSPDLLHPRVRLRYGLTERLLDDAGIPHQTVETRGRSALAQLMSLVLLGDYVSAYLALLFGVDPTPTAVIDELKARLGEQL